MSLGTYPETSLAAARRKASELRALIAEGRDPSDVRKASNAERQRQQEAKHREDEGLPPAGSFEAVAREWLEQVHGAKVSEGHAERTRLRLEQDVSPWLGRKALASITAPMLLECLRRVEARAA